MQAKETPEKLPTTVLLLGTDASGKNYVAKRLAERMRRMGRKVVVREGWLAAAPAPAEEVSKGRLSLLAEATFIRLFPLMRWFLPRALAFLMARDSRRFQLAHHHTQLIVSLNTLRILAFTLASRRKTHAEQPLPPWLERRLRNLKRDPNAVVLVLDVDDEVRKARIAKRMAGGDADPFDRYMAADGVRSERIESCMIWMAKTYLGATVIANNDLDDAALWSHFRAACATQTASG